MSLVISDMFRRLKILLAMGNGKRFLLIEAYIFLAWARLIKNRPFSKIAPSLGDYMSETPLIDNTSNRECLCEISDTIHIMSRYTFWESMCLVKAIAGMKMLKRRKIESTLYLGTARDNTGNMIAHAWLRSGSFFISGSEEKEKFTVVAMFASKI